MATKYLGSEFDIHGGGLDLVFPHHENELAQSQAAGDPFAAYWLHNAWVTAGGEKMSKSLGNGLLVSVLVQRVRPVELRYYLGRRTTGPPGVQRGGAAGSRRRVPPPGGIRRARQRASRPSRGSDDFARGVRGRDERRPQRARRARRHPRDGPARQRGARRRQGRRGAVALAEIRAMLGVLGLDPFDPQWARGSGVDDRLRDVVDRLVAVALEQRQAARARRDYAAADAIRAQLERGGHRRRGHAERAALDAQGP